MYYSVCVCVFARLSARARSRVGDYNAPPNLLKSIHVVTQLIDSSHTEKA